METRRQLPHLQTPDSTYFVTFRCRPGLFLPKPARAIVMSAIRHCNGARIDLDAAVVMPDHGHLIFRVLGGLSLSAILQSIKGYSARSVNAQLGRTVHFGSTRVSTTSSATAGSWRRKLSTCVKIPWLEVSLPVGRNIHGCGSNSDRLESLSHLQNHPRRELQDELECTGQNPVK